MEEFYNFSGVEGDPAAGDQGNQEQAQQGQQEQAGQEQQTGVEQGPAAGDQGEEGRPEEDRVEQAFARRLAAEREKLEQAYAPYREAAVAMARRLGVPVEDLPRVLEQQAYETQQQQAMQQLRQALKEKLLLEDDQVQVLESLVVNLLDQHPAAQTARALAEQQREQAQLQAVFNRGAAEFRAKYPNVEPPKAVVDLWAASRGTIPLTTLYEQYQNLQREIEQRILAERGNRKTSGSVTGSPGQVKASIADLPADKFEELVEKAKRGELKDLKF